MDINVGDTAGKTVDGEVFDNGSVIGGVIPGVIVGGLIRSGEDALGTESENKNPNFTSIQNNHSV